jgi:imidazoleglycerol-phosphate dehydratase
MRKAKEVRKTKETEIIIELNLDGEGKSSIKTGIGFMDHMLELLAFHSQIDLTVDTKGDLEVDTHHTVEDIGLTFGKAFLRALGDKKGINRYSYIYLPMDEALTRIVLDISGRPYTKYDVNLKFNKIGDMESQSFKEFFTSFANESKTTLHIENLYGENDHHIIESVFKGFGRALKEGVKITSNKTQSTKGVL